MFIIEVIKAILLESLKESPVAANLKYRSFDFDPRLYPSLRIKTLPLWRCLMSLFSLVLLWPSS